MAITSEGLKKKENLSEKKLAKYRDFLAKVKAKKDNAEDEKAKKDNEDEEKAKKDNEEVMQGV